MRRGKKLTKKSEGTVAGPLEYDSPKSMMVIYFFFDEDFLLPPFFDDDEDLPPFLAAIQLTTFHAVRDLPVALTWQDMSDRSGKFDS